MSSGSENFLDEYDYIVIGSGAGGGTVAARIAEEGYRVLVLEAGADPKNLPAGTPRDDAAYSNPISPAPAIPKSVRLPDDYDVPCFHAMSTENRGMQWDFFVRHYASDDLQKNDKKFVAAENGVLYPRAGCLGGCTAHNAMITIYPHNDDWSHIAKLTGDGSWEPAKMRRHFERLEDCRHRIFIYRWLAKIGINPTRHGWNGWLRTESDLPLKETLADDALLQTIFLTGWRAFWALPSLPSRLIWALRSQLDPNDWRLVRANAVGIHYPPLHTKKHARHGTRERLLEVQAAAPDKLKIELDALATRILFDENCNAIGVEYLKGERLYQAHQGYSEHPGERRRMRAKREVIIAGGAFNTPQLLKLSGVGPKDELAVHGIEVVADLPGVGSNLQDRYEVGVTNRLAQKSWGVLKDAHFAPTDPQYSQWKREREGVFTTNGAVLAVIKRSFLERELPDLFCFGLLAKFSGYFPGYSKEIVDNPNYLTWAVLKAHTNNQGGKVTLRSANPLQRPQIDFNYFETGTGDYKADLASVVEGVRFVRTLTQPLKDAGIIAQEEAPGENVQTDEEIGDFVRYQSWGHHASCTCPIGSDEDPMAVLDSNFKVRGVHRLRVVDASVFPRIPGFFIVCAIYIVGEKAASVIIEEARVTDSGGSEPTPWYRRLLQFCFFCRKRN
jgi:choline dehydrogenase